MPREDDAVHSIEQPVFQSAIVDGHSSEPSPDSSAVVSEDEYNAYLKSLVARGQVGEAKGPADANSPAKVGEQAGPQKDEDRAGEGR